MCEITSYRKSLQAVKMPASEPRHQAPWHLAYYCVPVSKVSGRQHLQSARCHQLSVPRVCLSTFRIRAFSVARPTVWNSLPDH